MQNLTNIIAMKYSLTTLPTKTSNIFYGTFANYNIDKICKELGAEKKIIQNAVTNGLQDELDSINFYTEDGFCNYIINCGAEENFTIDVHKKALAKITNFIKDQKLKSVTIALPPCQNKSADWQLEQALLQIDAANYQLLDFKTKDLKPTNLKNVQLVIENASKSALQNAQAIAEGIKLTRNLGNTPANICTPTYLANTALELDKKFKKIKTNILSEEKMQDMGMHSLLAVAKGSKEFSQLVEINYKNNGTAKPIVLVGKGITFDSGGISLKPPAGMEEMKYDMCGAASVLGTIKAAAMMDLPVNIVGLLACAENMPGSNAVKPGDVVTSYSGKTIEITNTDAEGRLVLADALTYAERFTPEFVIDIATLTGAVIVALGNDISGLMTNDENLASNILKAAEAAQDKTWRLPIDPKINELLSSTVADMLNSPAEKVAGTVVAACFLSRFTEKYRWAHLDIAGTAWISGKNRTATGRPVPLLIQIIRDTVHAS